MSCVEVRLDAKDFNTIGQTVTQFIYPGSGTKVYAAWAGRKTSGSSSLHNHEVLINWFDWSNQTVGTPVQIQDDVGVNNDQVQLCVLDDGTFICAFGATGPRAVESTDNGATWGSSADLNGTYGSTNDQLLAMLTDGTNVWAFLGNTGGGANSRDIFAVKRTGIGTWAAAVKVDDGSGSSGPGHFLDTAALSGVPSGAMKDANTGFLLMDYILSGSGQITGVVSLYTTNGWASAGTRVTLKSYATSHNRTPSVVAGSDGRARVSWSDETTAAGANRPYLAYTDDWGKTWTLVGSPTITAAAAGLFSWDPTFDRAMWLGSDNSWFLGSFDSSSGVAHHLFKGGDSLAGWTDTICQNLSYGTATASSGDGFIAGGQWFRLFTRVNVAVYNVNILFENNVETIPGGPPPLLTEAPSGADVSNTLLVLDIADSKGWHARSLRGTCFAPWNEGDYTSERRKHILLMAAGTLDANVQDPAALPAIYKLDDEERFTLEQFRENADGSIVPVADPLPFYLETAEINLGEDGSQNVVRYFYLRYRRPTYPFTIQAWIDSQIANTKVVNPAWPEPAEVWWPMSDWGNVGTRVKFVVEDREDVDLVIENLAIKFRPKHWRLP